MEKILQRLKSNAGETLIESLVSILIFTLASILFLTMVSSSTRINESAKEMDEEVSGQRQTMEIAPTSWDDAVNVTFTASGYDLTASAVESKAKFVGDTGSLFVFYPKPR